MSQSVKFSDGSYLDATDVWDTTQEKTQQQQNSDVQDAVNSLNSSVSGLNTSVNSLNVTKARLGTRLQTTLNSANSWTPSAASATYDAASLTLPAGTWLVVGHFMDYQGYMRMWINNVSGLAKHAAHDTACSSWTLDCFAITTGSRTVTLRLRAQKASVAHTWTQDGNYWSLWAVCIG